MIKRIQSVDLIETYVYRTSKDLICKKEETKCNNIIKQCKKCLTLMMLQKLLVRDSGSGKTNSLFNLINPQPDIDKIYLFAEDPFETKYQLLINKRESTGLRHFDDPGNFIEYLNDMDDINKNTEEYKRNK